LRNNHTYLLLFVVIILVGFWLRVADLKNIPPGLHYDEGENLQRSWRLIHGYGFLPNFESIPEPFDAYVRAGFLSVVGVLPFNARLYAVFLNLLAIAATLAAARALYWKHAQREAIALTAGMTIAALPPYVMIGREIYASNWIPLTTMLSLTALVWAWRTNKAKYFVLAGVFPALGVTFYLSGMAFAGACILLVLLFAAYSRFRWPKSSKLLVTGVSAVITLIPWLSMFLWIPDWLTSRIEALEGPNLSDPAVVFAQIQAAIQPIFIPNTVSFPVYNPYTIAFLNPALSILFLIGLVVTFWRWRKPLSLAPLVILGVMLVPNILSNAPEQPIRMSGIYGALALLTGLGAGEVLAFRNPLLVHGEGDKKRRGFLWAAPLVLATLLIITPIITFAGVWYHYHTEPRLLDDPTDVRGWAFLYRQGYLDLMQQVAESEEPIYIPVEQLNSDLATVVLRPERYPMVRAYDGRALPAGTVVLPFNGITYGLPEYEHVPLQYAMLLPETHEILILPPLTLDAGQDLQQLAQADGSDLLTTQGWEIGRTLSLSDYNPFGLLQPQILVEWAENEPLVVFDNRLELLGIDTPDDFTPGEFIPVTLYWRLRAGLGQDYFVRLQAWDYSNTSRGTQNDKYALMFRYLYPPVMWTVGEIVSETRWIQVFEDAPPGGYRFAISVSTYPGPTPVSIAQAQQDDEWALVGRAAISPEAFVSTDDSPATTLDAQLDDVINLTGVTLETPVEELQPGDTLNVRLFWQVVAPIDESYTLFLHLRDADGNLVVQQDTLPFDGQYPTWAWAAGQTIVTSHALTVAGESAGPYTLSMGMYRYPSLERLVVTQNGVPSPDNMIILNPASR
jgi:hypothetical protein